MGWGRLVTTAAVLGAALTSGCDRKEAPASPAPPSPPGKLPYRTIDAELRYQHPDVAAFLDHFLQTCAAGDYAGYRKLVGRRFTPETRERFDAIYRALRSVAIEEIREITVPDLAERVYVVISSVELDPTHRVALRGANRQLAILVFQEEGQWRMGPAPAEFQPGQTADSQSAASESQPRPTFFPWDDEPNAG